MARTLYVQNLCISISRFKFNIYFILHINIHNVVLSALSIQYEMIKIVRYACMYACMYMYLYNSTFHFGYQEA